MYGAVYGGSDSFIQLYTERLMSSTLLWLGHSLINSSDLGGATTVHNRHKGMHRLWSSDYFKGAHRQISLSLLQRENKSIKLYCDNFHLMM